MVGHSMASPQVYARAGGLLYLLIIVVALCAELFVQSRLIRWSDSAVFVGLYAVAKPVEVAALVALGAPGSLTALSPP